MNGYQYVKQVLEHDNHQLDVLLFKLKKRENSFIEFKASFTPKSGSGDNEDECSWNVISDIIAIANSAGGAILLGIDDQGEYADGFLGAKNPDQYTRSLNTHITEKKEWKFRNKTYSILEKSRKRLAECVGIQNCKVNDKEVLVILIKPSEKMIIYNEIQNNDKDNSSERHQTITPYLAYRTKCAVASKTRMPLTAEALDDFEDREKDSDYIEQLWNEYIGKKDKQGTFCVTLTIVAAILTLVQMILIYTDGVLEASAKGLGVKSLILLASIPIYAVAGLIAYVKIKINKMSFLYNLNLYGVSFCIAALTYALKLFSDGGTNISLCIRIFIALGLFIAIWGYFYFIMPILVPDYETTKDVASNLPKPDEIDVKHPHFTWEWKCVDGNLWWVNAATLKTPYGEWKFQRHKILANCRLLDPRSIMRCYGTRAEVLDAFNDVKAQYEQCNSSEAVK